MVQHHAPCCLQWILLRELKNSLHRHFAAEFVTPCVREVQAMRDSRSTPMVIEQGSREYGVATGLNSCFWATLRISGDLRLLRKCGTQLVRPTLSSPVQRRRVTRLLCGEAVSEVMTIDGKRIGRHHGEMTNCCDEQKALDQTTKGFG